MRFIKASLSFFQLHSSASLRLRQQKSKDVSVIRRINVQKSAAEHNKLNQYNARNIFFPSPLSLFTEKKRLVPPSLLIKSSHFLLCNPLERGLQFCSLLNLSSLQLQPLCCCYAAINQLLNEKSFSDFFLWKLIDLLSYSQGIKMINLFLL